jgi:hypothetical protein
MSDQADSNALAFLRAVKGHWLTLMSGGVITVALGIFERLSGKNLPLWVYAVIVLSFVVIASYLAFRDERQKAIGTDAGERRRDFLAQRLTQLLKEAAEVDFGAVSLGGGRGIGALTRSANHHARVRSFLEAHWEAAIVKRYEEDGNRVLEELLAEVLSDDQAAKPKLAIAAPKLEIKVVEAIYAWTEDTRVQVHHVPRDSPCFITLSVKITNPRSSPISLDSFKLYLDLDGKEYISYAEETSFGRRLIDRFGNDGGEYEYQSNLNAKENKPVTIIQDQPKEGTLQFVIREVTYIQSITIGTDEKLGGASFTLVVLDTNWEKHTQTGNLCDERGCRYVNPANAR